jgi:TRAP-type C4-dicarboxylate transport system permease small subunit
MDAVYLRLPPAVRRALNIAIAVLGIALCGYVSKIGFDSMAREIDYETLLPSGYLPAWPQTLAIPLCFALMTVAYLSFLYSVVTDRRQRSPGEAPDVPEGR